jgi:hypothetical protein
LVGGQQYFMILGPLSLSDASANVWYLNNQGVTGLNLLSDNGGVTWVTNSNPLYQIPGAFDVLSTPEPGSLLLLGTGLVGMLGVAYRRRKETRQYMQRGKPGEAGGKPGRTRPPRKSLT